MADNFGLKIGIEGEKDFKRAIADINKDFRVLSSELKSVTSQFDTNDRSIKNLSAQNEVLNKQIENQKNKISTLKAALDNAASSFGENDKRTKEWQIKLNNAEAELNKMNRQLEANKKDMESAENATDEESKALADMGKAADQSGSKLEGLGKALSGTIKAATAAAAAVGAAAVAVGKKIWDMANDTAAAGDEIDKQSQKLGISAENYQKLAYAMERSGADVEDFRKGAANISKELANVQKGVKGAGSQLEQLEVKTKNADGSIRSTEDVLLDTIDALANMTDEARRNALANQIFGRSYQELAPLLNSGSDGIRDLMNEADKYGMVMSDKAVKASAAFQDSLTRLKGTITGVKNTMMSQLLPGITSITDGLSDMIAGVDGGKEKLKDGVKSTIDSIKEMIPQGLDLLKTFGSALLESAPTLLESLTDGVISLLPDFLDLGLNNVLPKLITSAISVAGNLIQSLSASLPELMVNLSQTIVDLISKLASPENIQSAISTLLGCIESIISGVQQSLPILIEGATQLITGLISALPGILSDGIPRVIDMIFGEEGGLLSSKNIRLMINSAVDVVMSLVSNLPTIISALIDAIPTIINAIFDPETGFLSEDNLSKLINGAVKIVAEIVKNIPLILAKLIASIPSILDSIMSGFWGLVDRFGDLAVECAYALTQPLADILRYLPIQGKESLIAMLDYYSSQRKVPAFATGGIVTKPTIGWIGDAGAEAVVPLENNTGWIQKIAEQLYSMNAGLIAADTGLRTAAAASPGATYSINISFGDVQMSSDQDIDAVAYRISDIIAAQVISEGRAYS